MFTRYFSQSLDGFREGGFSCWSFSEANIFKILFFNKSLGKNQNIEISSSVFI